MVVSFKSKNTYSEVFELLKYVDRNDLDKIPIDILNAIKDNRNKDYEPKIDFSNLKNCISDEAAALYVGLCKKYIVQDKSEIQGINKVLYENEIKKNAKTDYAVFHTEDESKNESTESLVVYKESSIRKIINRLKSIFRSGGKKRGN